MRFEFIRLLKLVLSILVAFSLSGCNVVNSLRLKYANDDVLPQWNHTQTSFDLVTDYIGEKAYVYGSVNGVDGFKFMIDTGASYTILFDTPRVKQLTLKEGYRLALSGWGDEESSPSYQTVVERLSFGKIDFEHIAVAFMPVSTSRYFLREDEVIYDGVIGYDTLRHFVWQFDKKAERVTVFNQPYQQGKSETLIPFDEFMGKISIDTQVDFGDKQMVDHDFIIDTGSRHYIKISATYVGNHQLRLPGTQITAADFGLNGKTVHKRASLPVFNLGELRLEDVKTNFIHTDDEDDFWVIGNALLGQYVTTIDYMQGNLYLAPYQDSEFSSRYNLLGLELRKLRNQNFVVRYVFPHSPANDRVIQVGDEVYSINGVKAEAISHDQWLSISNTPGEYVLCFVAASCVSLTSTEIRGYSM
ncbi:aspartyl protease family protein [Pleionea sp. CnH1-48]|uniref:aspartyl protease family protein n=1 Tax=Pleionea sp. CnH1-48 TaxID=2954494 RepID=UPI002097A14D|nr:aspartyl protease family protein [Pleionea sp. CnH1-48]MCO7222739.1 aspartyl protease family protein [Pleionea sp. CnH1-48]